MNEIIRQIPDWLIPLLILFTSVIAAGIILDRVLLLMFRVKSMNLEQERTLLEFIRAGSLDKALEYCAEPKHTHPAFAVARVLLESGRKGLDTMSMVESEIHRATSYLKNYLQTLGTISTIAPLLGLLGTVTGMIKSFHAFDGNKVRNAQLVGGIDEALITTTLGLMVAIPALIAYNYLANRVNLIAEETTLLSEHVAQRIDGRSGDGKNG